MNTFDGETYDPVPAASLKLIAKNPGRVYSFEARAMALARSAAPSLVFFEPRFFRLIRALAS